MTAYTANVPFLLSAGLLDADPVPQQSPSGKGTGEQEGDDVSGSFGS
jgi:hypothetical protein